MSLENELKKLNDNLVALTAMLGEKGVTGGNVTVEPEAPKVEAKPEPKVETPAPAPTPEPKPEPKSAPAATDEPTFANAQELMKFTMEQYQRLGSQKGAQIQNIMLELGYKNINDIGPEHYAEYKSKVEALS